MKLFNPQEIKKLGIALTCLCLAACDTDDAIDLVPKKETSIFTFVNTLDVTATFYIKEKIRTKNIFDRDHKAYETQVDMISNTYSYDWSKAYKNTTFGVQDSNSKNNKFSFNADIESDVSYWTVAWLLNDRYQLSVFEKKRSNQPDVYKIRILAHSDMDVRVNNSNETVTRIKAGEISDVYTTDNCAAGIQVGNNTIDLCTGDFGKSYLLVVDSNGKRVMAQE